MTIINACCIRNAAIVLGFAVGSACSGALAAGPLTGLLGTLSGNQAPGAGALLPLGGSGGLAGLGILSGENSGTGGLLGLDLIDNDSLLGLDAGAASVLDLGDLADPLADALQSLGTRIRASKAGVDALPDIPGVDGASLPLSPLLGVALGGSSDATGNLLGLGLLTGDNVVNDNLISAIIAGGDSSATGNLLGAGIIGGKTVGNGGLVGASAIAGDTSGNGGLVGAGILSGSESGNGGLIGLSVLSDGNSGNGGLIGLSVLSGDNSGNGGLLGAGVLSASNVGNGGLLGIGLATGDNSGSIVAPQGGVLLFGQNGQPVVDVSAISGGDATDAGLLDVSLLESGQIIDIRVTQVPVLQIEDPAGFVGGAEDLRAGLQSLGEELIPLVAGLPGGDALVAVLSNDLSQGVETVADAALSPLLDEQGNALGLALLGDRADSALPALGLGVLGGNNDGNGSEAGVAVLSGDNSGNGGPLGVGVLSGQNSGASDFIGVAALNNGPAAGGNNGGGLAGLDGLNGANGGAGINDGTGAENSVAGLDDASLTGEPDGTANNTLVEQAATNDEGVIFNPDEQQLAANNDGNENQQGASQVDSGQGSSASAINPDEERIARDLEGSNSLDDNDTSQAQDACVVGVENSPEGEQQGEVDCRRDTSSALTN